jgi:hypothetical protein
MKTLSGLFLRHWAILVLLSAAAVGAATPEFTLRFGATGDLTISPDAPLVDPDKWLPFQLGFREGALSSGDDDLDLPYPIIPGPGGGIRLYFPADGDVASLYQDYRPPAVTGSWQMDLVDMSAGKSVTLSWRLEDGDLAGNRLSLKDRITGEVLAADMMVTRSCTLADASRSLLVLYTTRNHPPVARGDVAAMLQSAVPLQIPFADLLANDYDPDLDDTFTIVAVGNPFVPGGVATGDTAYGTTSIDLLAHTITYAVPATLPTDWDGVVYFPYTIQDDNPDTTTLHEGTATVAVTVAPHVLTVPTPTQVPAHQGMPVTVSYTLVYADTLNSLVLSFILPLTGEAPNITFWPFSEGSYVDSAAGTVDPTITNGAGVDGQWATGDDTGEVKLDFGTNVPPSGTTFSFVINTPASAADATLPSLASYKTAADAALLKQLMPDVALRIAYTLTFASAGHGTIRGTASQLLEPGRQSTQITAEADTGYHFLRWLRGNVEISRESSLTVAGGATDMTITAEFAITTYAITFGFTCSGSLSGQITQNVPYLGSASPVLAVPDTDSYFYQWTDGDLSNPRTVSGVTGPALYTAAFLPLTPGEPIGHFELVFQNQTGGFLRTLWDLTGHYAGNVDTNVLTLDLTCDERGLLGGVGQLQGTVGAQPFVVSNMPFKGSSDGKNGALTIRGGMAGGNGTTSVTLKLSLAVTGRTLAGVVTGVVTNTSGGRVAINSQCVFDLPAAMDGTYRLPTDLTLGTRGAITGTSTLILANGRTIPLLVKGKRVGAQTTLELSGNRATNPAFAAVSFTLTVRTYTNRTAGIRGLGGKAFGQILSWHL